MTRPKEISGPGNTPTICILALPESASIVLYGLYEVLSTFSDAWSALMSDDEFDARFNVRIVAQQREMFRCFGGVPVIPNAIITDDLNADVVIVTDLAIDANQDPRGRWPEAEQWLQQMHQKGAVIGSVCSGSVLLACAGLLNNKPATTHWGFVNLFKQFFPEVELQPDRILLPLEPDYRIVTAGGMSAWEDFVLYLIARFHGEAAAIKAAKLYLFGDRREGQILYAARLIPKRHEDAPIASAQIWIAEHYSSPNSIEKMTVKSGLPGRTFKRRFKQATGMSPLEYMQCLRIEEAKQMLETTDDAIDTIVPAIGYDDPASFRRLFKRLAGVTPGKYRQRFRKITNLTA